MVKKEYFKLACRAAWRGHVGLCEVAEKEYFKLACRAAWRGHVGLYKVVKKEYFKLPYKATQGRLVRLRELTS